LDEKCGPEHYTLIKMEINWAEKVGLWLNSIGPIIIGIGLLGLFIEFKTPGFGFFGIAGIVFVLIFFGSKYVSGLAGQEEVLVFLLGVSLVIVELFLFPGLVFPAIIGLFLIVGSILWAMVDIWPNTEFSWNLETFQGPIQELFLAILVTIGLVVALTRILPKTSLWDNLVLSSSAGDKVPIDGNEKRVMPGTLGKTVSELYPTGQVEVDGIRYEARANLGKIEKGSSIEVTGSTDYGLIVAKR
jgi:membrane-bound serine protease (ClpP class)